MKNNTPIIIGAALAVVILAGLGVYAYTNRASSGPNAGGDQNQNQIPASIKVFQVQKPNFVAKGENLSKVEIWAIKAGGQIMLGSAVKQGSGGAGSLGDTWTMPIPASVKGSTGIFAKGYDQTGSPAARMDLTAADLAKI